MNKTTLIALLVVLAGCGVSSDLKETNKSLDRTLAILECLTELQRMPNERIHRDMTPKCKTSYPCTKAWIDRWHSECVERKLKGE